MVDELYDRQYRDGRRELNDFLARAGNAFAVLNRIEYSAPWLEGSRRARNHSSPMRRADEHAPPSST